MMIRNQRELKGLVSVTGRVINSWALSAAAARRRPRMVRTISNPDALDRDIEIRRQTALLKGANMSHPQGVRIDFWADLRRNPRHLTQFAVLRPCPTSRILCYQRVQICEFAEMPVFSGACTEESVRKPWPHPLW